MKIFKFFVVLLLIVSCKQRDELVPQNLNGSAFASASGRALYPFGKYKLISFENNANLIYNVDLEIKNEKDANGHFILNGKSNANFYFAKFDADFAAQTLKIYGVGTTEIGGTYNELKFEKEYLERLANVVSYQFSLDGSKLFLLSEEEKGQTMTFSLDKN
jgi:hypothetical protein